MKKISINPRKCASKVYVFIEGLFEEEDEEDEYLYFANLFAEAVLDRFDLDIEKCAWHLLYLMELCQLLVRFF